VLHAKKIRGSILWGIVAATLLSAVLKLILANSASPLFAKSMLATQFTLAKGIVATPPHSVGEFVNQLRVCRAMEQLQRSEMPLAEVALHAGFADQSQFTKTFRRYHGTTPGSVHRAFAGDSRPLRRG
jgi:AraC-like DNA-binding protein